MYSVFKPITAFERIFHWKANTYIGVTITAFRQNISLWEGVLVLEGQYIHTSRENRLKFRFERIFHFGRVCWS